MKKIFSALSLICLLSSCEVAQQVLNQSGASTGPLSSEEIASGLKEALTIGTQNGTNKLSMADGFFADAAVKILLPAEAQKVETTLRSLGMGSLIDKAILSMNRAAEDAAKSATPIFVNAIKQMTISDALGILQGGESAATNYFKDKTTGALTTSFSPVVHNALQKTEATKYWKEIFTTYNQFAAKDINPDLDPVT